MVLIIAIVYVQLMLLSMFGLVFLGMRNETKKQKILFLNAIDRIQDQTKFSRRSK